MSVPGSMPRSGVIAALRWPEILPVARRYGPALLLLALTYALGVAGQSIARPLFILGCIAVSWDAMRFGAASHLAVSFLLFCLAPFLRRVVDVNAGYDASGIMIAGTLLAISMPAPRVLAVLTSGRPIDPAMRPFLLAFVCPLYATVLTILFGSLVDAANYGLKWFAPLVYGMWILGEARREDDVLAPLTRMAMMLVPLMGLYGLLQYVDPPLWDRYWMTNTTIASIGQPEPYMVRVFSTMNAPAGYATFTAVSLLLFGFRKASLSLILAAAPATLGLMLTMYRTAWIGLAFGVVFGLFNARTRTRAIVLLLVVPILSAGVISFTPAADALQQRLQTLGAVGEDASGQERLAEYAHLLDVDNGTLIGNGFGTIDVLQAGTLALDGQFINCWWCMGLIIGMVCVAAIIWAGLQGIIAAWRSDSLSGLAVTGILAALMSQMPLAAISYSETGFLFWAIAAIAVTTRPRRNQSPAREREFAAAS